MAVIHPVYLPFTPEVLLRHFARIRGQEPGEKHLRYYLESAARAAAFEKTPPIGTSTQVARSKRLALQMQKDERFWVVTALLSAFHAPDRTARLSGLLTLALGATPPVPGHDSWASALGAHPRLYFEANLPSPTSYKDWLADHLRERALVPYLLEPALQRGARVLEGATRADAVLVAPDTGFAVVFEAKVLSDVSQQISFDAARNQIARSIDVILDPHTRLDDALNARQPAKTCFVLLTPQLFRKNPSTRLYGWLMKEYRKDGALLAEHLPHRRPEQLRGLSSRLGWLTWEECNAVVPGCCAWLG